MNDQLWPELAESLAQPPDLRRGYMLSPNPPHNRRMQEWAQRCENRLRAGLEVRREPDRVSVTLFGVPLPGAAVDRLPDGLLRFDYQPRPPADNPPYGWSPRIPLLAPGAPPAKFLKRQSPKTRWRTADPAARGGYGFLKIEPEAACWWGLEPALDALLHHRLPGLWTGCQELLYHREAPREPMFQTAAQEWAAAASQLADHDALAELRRLTGNAASYTIRHHNLALCSLPAIRELARTNPGALGWWMHQYNLYDDEAAIHAHRINRRRRGDNHRQPEPPYAAVEITPAEVVRHVKDHFGKASGRNWKALTTQPAGDLHALLNEFVDYRVTELSDLLGKAQLHHPSGKKRPQPPRSVKKLAVRHNGGAICHHPVKLLLRAAAGKPLKSLPPPPQDGRQAARPTVDIKAVERSLTYALDYAIAEPEAARRAATWNGLLKSSERWHRQIRHNRRQHTELKIREQYGVDPDQVWPAPPQGPAPPEFFRCYPSRQHRARLLENVRELDQEAWRMEHCVSGLEYARHCRDGHSRIFHLEPQDQEKAGGDPWQETTVELVRDEGPGWRIRQHQGYRNRAPDRAERQAADQLLKLWNQACQGA